MNMQGYQARPMRNFVWLLQEVWAAQRLLLHNLQNIINTSLLPV